MTRDETIIRDVQAAQIPQTALIKTLELEPETGSTSVSLKNFKKIKDSPLDFTCIKIVFNFDKHPKLQTEWLGSRQKLTWDFSGFNAGYSGEGPHGLMKILKTLGYTKWDMNMISGLENGTYEILK